MCGIVVSESLISWWTRREEALALPSRPGFFDLQIVACQKKEKSFSMFLNSQKAFELKFSELLVRLQICVSFVIGLIGLHICICTELHKQDSNHKYPRLSSSVRILKNQVLKSCMNIKISVESGSSAHILNLSMLRSDEAMTCCLRANKGLVMA